MATTAVAPATAAYESVRAWSSGRQAQGIWIHGWYCRVGTSLAQRQGGRNSKQMAPRVPMQPQPSGTQIVGTETGRACRSTSTMWGLRPPSVVFPSNLLRLDLEDSYAMNCNAPAGIAPAICAGSQTSAQPPLRALANAALALMHLLLLARARAHPLLVGSMKTDVSARACVCGCQCSPHIQTSTSWQGRTSSTGDDWTILRTQN